MATYGVEVDRGVVGRVDHELVAHAVAVAVVALGLDDVEEAHALPFALPGDGEIAVVVHADRRHGLGVGGGGVHPELAAQRPHALDGRVGDAVMVHVGFERDMLLVKVTVPWSWRLDAPDTLQRHLRDRRRLVPA